MVNLLVYNYFYRYNQKRKNTKSLVENLNYAQAKTDLELDITEQENSYPNINNNRNFIFGENRIMKHCLNHLNAVIDKNNPSFFDLDTGQLKQHSDIVKESLDEETRPDYSDVD